MLKLVRSIVSVLARRFRSRAVLELENLALRHQLHVLRRQRPGRPRLFAIDRLLWVWLYRLWPRCLDTMVLVKPATVVQWHRQGFRLFWRWRSRTGRPSVDRERMDTTRVPIQMSANRRLRGARRDSKRPRHNPPSKRRDRYVVATTVCVETAIPSASSLLTPHTGVNRLPGSRCRFVWRVTAVNALRERRCPATVLLSPPHLLAAKLRVTGAVNANRRQEDRPGTKIAFTRRPRGDANGVAIST